MIKISAVINTLNDEKTITRCLTSISWVDDIVVVDLGSADKTLPICQGFKAKIYSHPKVEYVELVRNFSLDKATGEWILVVDPDEEIPPSLKEELLRIVKANQYEAVLIPRKNFIFGKFISHTAWWPDYKLRFFKKGQVSWSGEIHIDGKSKGEAYKLPSDPNLAIIHYAYKDIASFLARANRYSQAEAEEKFNKGERATLANLSFSILKELGKRGVKGMAFLDGMYGFILVILTLYCQFLTWGKLWEKEKSFKRK
jgi:glycosyltransferase involved in cell wall biosynthesis